MGRLMNFLALLILALIVAAGSPRAQSLSAGLPTDADAVMKRVRDAARFDWEILREFTYVERRRDIRMSKLGKVTLGPLRTFEVYPSNIPGRTYKRLIEVDGRPLDAAELARRNAERDRSLREVEERRSRETTAERAARLDAEDREKRRREAVLDDALALFRVSFTRREIVEGQPVLIGTVAPRPNVQPRTREGRWARHFAGEVWIAEADQQIARLDMRALEDVSIGWGILGRVHKDSRFLFTRRKTDGRWLPAQVTVEASGRTLLFRRFQLSSTTTYSNYRRRIDVD